LLFGFILVKPQRAEIVTTQAVAGLACVDPSPEVVSGLSRGGGHRGSRRKNRRFGSVG
jgi:hypothetical protein